MKMTLTLLLLCFCTSLFAQNSDSKKDEGSTFAPFAWYTEQEERKEAFLKDYFKSNLEDFGILPKVTSETEEEVVAPKMPIYPVPKSRLSPMPIIPSDTVIKQYLKVYPVKEE
ncbi:hypothetical protein GCM10011344_01720 [Dokdonia pacifica]|uniref:Uncharacterized protein n=1 Tax=Dokdonia pacifica TaxID=1627892 RepID=A0A238Z8S4_9FLAO|nr:hypothetical protein [Dokdonia pacifica]GGG04995.1 hypothetical protein GCM10011344_01720 [Dokdonia pacifica]SNR79670.1 hypothetical protein SAMN06265376_10332 [Dokdonia pacifica]